MNEGQDGPQAMGFGSQRKPNRVQTLGDVNLSSITWAWTWGLQTSPGNKLHWQDASTPATLLSHRRQH